MIRPAELKDAKALAVLTTQLGYEVDPYTVEERLTRILPTTTNGVFVSEAEDQTLSGWAHVYGKTLIELEYAEIGGIVVDHTFRRSGMGKKLMDACEEWAKANGYDEIRLRSGEQRAEAHQFYLGIGYEHSSNQKVFKKALKEGE
ncbi:GNAT family N-acetyltransferase [Alkalicoccobacillus porphyridii]|uniref:GNAT family N-acetyltransferase n=1 Tax=Alkalicoccobacillus porphyridii TaxID=2597270 RepID=A0A553ZX16_9BACI|nr:GNAT family N-acetyltransferase [Alkalicoccobacillus porphyridii]TSB45997.1 GNAT family N-acetyltransferase [Alkalicoccobacillus porphyridii]